MIQALLAISVVLVLISVGLRQPVTAAFGALVFAVFVGEIRRVLAFVDAPLERDPLLLVTPAVTVVLALRAWQEGQLDPRTRVAQLVLLTTMVMVLQVFNPTQGPIIIGISGLLFYTIPLQWFWVGQGWGGRDMVEVLLVRVLAPVAVVAAAMGVYQLWFGPLPHQQAWLDRLGTQLMIYVNGRIRAFSVFSSASEYSHFLAIVIAGLVAWRLGGGRSKALIVVPFLVVALVLIGSRGILIVLAFSITACWAVRGRTPVGWAARLVVAFLFIGGLGLYGLRELNRADLPEQVQPLIQRQVSGFENVGESTASAHTDLMIMGVTTAVRQPLGLGLGATTLAGLKFGGYRVTAEFDISNMFLSLGLAGGIVYVLLVVAVVADALAAWRDSGEPHTLVVFGVIIAEFGAWLFSGHYATNCIVWLLIGVANAGHRWTTVPAFPPRPGPPAGRRRLAPAGAGLPPPAAAEAAGG